MFKLKARLGVDRVKPSILVRINSGSGWQGPNISQGLDNGLIVLGSELTIKMISYHKWSRVMDGQG